MNWWLKLELYVNWWLKLVLSWKGQIPPASLSFLNGTAKCGLLKQPLLSGKSQPNTNKAIDFSVPARMNKACKIQPVHSKLPLFFLPFTPGINIYGRLLWSFHPLALPQPSSSYDFKDADRFFFFLCTALCKTALYLSWGKLKICFQRVI